MPINGLNGSDEYDLFYDMSSYNIQENYSTSNVNWDEPETSNYRRYATDGSWEIREYETPIIQLCQKCRRLFITKDPNRYYCGKCIKPVFSLRNI